MDSQSASKPPSRVYRSGIGGAGNYQRLNDSKKLTSPSKSPPGTAVTVTTTRNPRKPVPAPAGRRMYRSGIGGAGNYHRRAAAAATPTTASPLIASSSPTSTVVVVKPPPSNRSLFHSGIGGAGNYHSRRRASNSTLTTTSTTSNNSSIRSGSVSSISSVPPNSHTNNTTTSSLPPQISEFSDDDDDVAHGSDAKRGNGRVRFDMKNSTNTYYGEEDKTGGEGSKGNVLSRILKTLSHG